MRVAVLMSTYNGEKYLREQIESILAQVGDFTLDLWVRDDGSQDKTVDILEEYAYKKGVKWYSGENLGPAHSFLNLIQHCSGYDYYAFADQDDYWMSDKIFEGLLALKDACVPALYCANAELVDAKLKPLGRLVYRTSPKLDFETLMCARGLLGCTMIFNDLLAKEIQNHEMPNKITMHDAFVALACLTVGGEIIFDQRAHMKYRQHGNNVVGVSQGKIQTLKGRMKDIFTRDEIGIAENASELKRYSAASSEIEEWIERVCSYKRSLISRALLAFSMRTRYMSLNMSITYRLKILLGNR